ncbi:MAG: hypothetical protein RLZZ591_1126 [Pseudomonadota bacterium]|jgi:integrase
MSVVSLHQAHIQDQELGLCPPKYLHYRNNTFYYKRKVPARMCNVMNPPRKQIWKSLQTTDFSEAVELLAVENRIFEDSMNDAKFELSGHLRTQITLRPRGKGTTKYLLDEHIPFVVARYRYMQLMQADEERAKASQQEIAEQRVWVAECLRFRMESASRIDLESMKETAEMLLNVERLIAPPESLIKQKLMQYLLAAELDILKEHLQRLDGTSSPEPLEQPIAPRDMPTMLEAYKGWLAKRAPGEDFSDELENVDSGDRSRKFKKVRLRTVETYGRYVAEFESHCGALPTEAITISHVNRYRDFLAEDGLLRVTVKNHIGGLAAILRASFSSTEKLKNKSDKNVFDFVDYECVPERADEDRRRAYEVSELAVLFQSPIYTEGMPIDGQCQEAAFWVPLLSPFAGCRIEELAQLRMEDVQRVNEVWALRVANLGDDQEIKTPASFRLIPIHEEVIRCGFLAYVAEQKLAGHTRVFPSLRNDNKHRKWSNALGKWFSRYLDAIGLNDVRLCHHSFRFNFAQQVTNCGADTRICEALMGHWLTATSAKSKSRYYASPAKLFPFEALVKAIRNLRYQELDLSHLYVKEPLKDVEVLLTYTTKQQNTQTRSGMHARRAKRGTSSRVRTLLG